MNVSVEEIKEKRDNAYLQILKLNRHLMELQTQYQQLNEELIKIKSHAEAYTLLLPEELRNDLPKLED